MCLILNPFITYLFCVQKIRENLRKQAEELKKSTETGNLLNNGDSNLFHNGVPQIADHVHRGGNRWFLRGTVTNMLFLAGIAAFAFVVKHVVTNVVETI